MDAEPAMLPGALETDEDAVGHRHPLWVAGTTLKAGLGGREGGHVTPTHPRPEHRQDTLPPHFNKYNHCVYKCGSAHTYVDL